MTQLTPLAANQTSPEIPINENFDSVSAYAVFARRHPVTTGLTWGYYGGIYNGNTVVEGTVALTDDADNYIVVARTTGVVSVSTATTNWDNASSYARLYKVTAASGVVTDVDDHRMDSGGLLSAEPLPTIQCIPIACSDETTALTAGTGKVTFHMPFAFTLTEVIAGLTTPQSSGSIFTVNVNEAGSSILSTKLTIDNGEETSLTAAAPPVISDTALAKGAKITIDVDQVGDGTATGLKVYLVGNS